MKNEPINKYEDVSEKQSKYKSVQESYEDANDKLDDQKIRDDLVEKKYNSSKSLLDDSKDKYSDYLSNKNKNKGNDEEGDEDDEDTSSKEYNDFKSAETEFNKVSNEKQDEDNQHKSIEAKVNAAKITLESAKL
jgi:hypothetical protein